MAVKNDAPVDRAEQLRRKKEQSLVWRAKNRDAQLIKQKAYYAANAEAVNEAKRRALRTEAPETTAARAACQKAWRAKNRDALKAKHRAYWAANKERLRENNRRWREAHPSYNTDNARAWTAANPGKAKANLAAWRKANPRYASIRMGADPEFLILCRLRGRLKKVLLRAGATARKPTRDLIGCTGAELKAHLEAQFPPGMSWANRDLWHIDHVKPCCTFDLTDVSQQGLCFHFSNLRPLWVEQNLARKRKRYDPDVDW